MNFESTSNKQLIIYYIESRAKTRELPDGTVLVVTPYRLKHGLPQTIYSQMHNAQSSKTYRIVLV